MNNSLRITTTQMAGGISKQPPHARLPGQLADGSNLNLSVVDGMNNRAGTYLDRVIAAGTLTAAGNYRLLPFDRDVGEQYQIIYGIIGSDFSIKAYRVDGAASTVTISAAAQKYLNLNGATCNDIRPVIVADTIYFVNTTVMVGTLPSDTYSLTATWDNYDQMVARTPTDGTYHRTTGDSGSFEAGYWKYDVDGVTFAIRSFQTVTGTNQAYPGAWGARAIPYEPLDFRIGFQRRSLSISSASWDGSTDTITKAGAFTEVRTNEYVYVSAGTGFTATWYQVLSRTDDAIVIGSGINTVTGNVDVTTPGGTPSDLSITGLGSYYTMSMGALDNPQSMDEVAAAFQTALRNDGADDCLVAWVDLGYHAGYMVITSPYRGSGATFFGPYPATGGSGSLVLPGAVFNGTLSGTASVTAGTGTIDGTHLDTLAVNDRWTDVSESGQADAQIDPATMPVVMTRTQVGATSAFTVSSQTFDARTNGTPTTNPSPSLWMKTGATQGTIIANTLANPTVITSTAHGLTSGDTVHITGSNSTPTIDGARVATVLSADTFSVPVNVSGAGTAGTWRKGGLMISDVSSKDDRTVYAGGNSVVLSEIRDSNNFYLDDATNIVDSDPIDMPIRGVTNIDFLVPYRKTIVAFTLAGQQYEMNTPEVLTPSTAGWTKSTSHETRSVRPKVMGTRMYFVGSAQNYSVVYEYMLNELTVTSSAFEITTHVLDLIPTNIITLDTNANNGMVLVLPADDGRTARMFVYKAFWSGDTKQQSAWCRWNFDPGYRICDIAVLKDRLWMLVESCGIFTSAASASPTTITSAGHGLSNGNTVYIPSGASPSNLVGTHVVSNVTTDTFTIPITTTSNGYGKWSLGEYTLEHLTLSREATRTGWAYAIHMDRQIELTGSHAAGTTTFTLTAPNGGSLTARGSTVNRIVLGPAFGASSGNVATITGYGATDTVTLSGNYSAGSSVVGAYITASATLTRPFIRDQRGEPDFYGTVLTSDLLTVHNLSGPYSVGIDYTEGQSDATTTFTPTSTVSGDADSILKSQAEGEVEKFVATITANNPRPFNVCAMQWIGKPSEGLR